MATTAWPREWEVGVAPATMSTTSNQVWIDWTRLSTATTTVTSNAPANAVWPQWVANGTATTSVTMSAEADRHWNRWAHPGYDPHANETPDERQARLERESRARLEAQQRAQADAEKRARADERAWELLMMLLTEDERAWMAGHPGEIRVRNPTSGRLWVIRTGGGVHGNVSEVDEHGCNLGTVCAAPRMYDPATRQVDPTADGWVGQLLMARHDDGEFDRVGHWSRRSGCRHAAKADDGRSAPEVRRDVEIGQRLLYEAGQAA